MSTGPTSSHHTEYAATFKNQSKIISPKSSLWHNLLSKNTTITVRNKSNHPQTKRSTKNMGQARIARILGKLGER